MHNLFRGAIMKSNKSDDLTDVKEAGHMGMSTLNERYCTVRESIIESFKEVNLMCEGKLPKKTWNDYMNEHKKRDENQ